VIVGVGLGAGRRRVPGPALYATAGAAGADLRANLPERARGGRRARPGARALVPTGLILAIPAGFEGQVRMRSGLALRHGLWLPNAPGTIDSDYRGPVAVLVANGGDAPVTLRHGDRVAQIVMVPVVQASFSLAHLDATARGAGGFGSTGPA
jgi:dUTP pyrophosphatase